MTQTSTKPADLAAKIDHTLLKPTLTVAEIATLCQEAMTHKFKTVCIPPSWVKGCVKILEGSGVGTITVVGFPLGYSTTESKCFEAKTAISHGASEIDMVANVSWIKSGRMGDVENDIREVVAACGSVPVKVIIETAYLTDLEKVAAAQAAERAGAQFVKTSTGFATGNGPVGATLADIQLLRKNLKPSTLIKASGGIRDIAMARKMIEAGANRLGTSASVSILNGFINESGY